ncbi:MAG: peptidoglycan-associated lipoprotein Pal [Nitrospirota bacterium]
MKKLFMLTVLFGFVVIFMGCPPKKVAKPEIEQPPTTSQEAVQKTTEVGPEEKITEQELTKIESAEITKEESPKSSEKAREEITEKDILKDIYFDFDMYNIQPDAKTTLETITAWLLKDPSKKILIEGHCDERGTNEYNLALGDRRAKAARDYLIALGIAPKRIEMVSYGEEKPLCADQSEECWAKNRRAHFVILQEAGK